MISFEVSAEKANVNIEDGTVIVTGVDPDELMVELRREIGVTGVLDGIDYGDICEYVAEAEKEKADEEYDRQNDR